MIATTTDSERSRLDVTTHVTVFDAADNGFIRCPFAQLELTAIDDFE
jgi:hypothetical protein